MISLFLALIELHITPAQIEVQGKQAEIFSVTQSDGTQGVRLNEKDFFDVTLRNRLNVPSSIHWHGLVLPNDQDGVAFVTQFPLYPGQDYSYRFPLVQSGTYWMHSHVGLQEQRLLSAPLIISSENDKQIADQEVVLLLTDFSFRSPEEIFTRLRKPMQMEMSHDKPDLVEVDYDAFLTNLHTLEKPEVVTVQPGSKVRLRIIDGSSATNFFINTGSLSATAIAVDGHSIEPLVKQQFELAVAQRIDLLVTIPKEGGAFPILAQGEGTAQQTGLILATPGAQIPKLSDKAEKSVGGLTNLQEGELRSLTPLSPKKVDQTLTLELGGDMASYVWTLNGQAWPEVTPLVVEKGQRVELIFTNKTGMSHPMHLHGHVFQVTQIDERPVQGALRDTLLVMPNSTIAVQFDADNPGVWPLHCHILYHMEAGMFTVLRYMDFQQPLSLLK